MSIEMSEKRVRVAVIGSGLGGLAIAAQIKSSITTDMVVFEKGSDLGGVWQVNRYPNAACDTPVEMYAMTFFSKHNWSSNFAPWREILDYANELADHYSLRDNIRFNSLVTSAVWLNDESRWRITLASGESWKAEFLMWAGGLFSQPLVPNLPGMASFKGQVIHTAGWSDDIDLSGKRVALVGAGASSIQVLPYAVEHAKQVYAFIRTPSYVMPKAEEFYGEKEWASFKSQPELQTEKRNKWMDFFEGAARSRFPMDEAGIAVVEDIWKKYIEEQVRDPSLRQLLTPDYRFGCKRPLVSNAYYRSFNQPNIQAVAGGVTGFFEDGVTGPEGEEYGVDVVVLATGFKTSKMLGDLNVVGRTAQSLSALWGDRPEAYLGMFMKGFPNFFMVGGPNATAASLSSMVEAQAGYIKQCIRKVDATGAGRIEVRPEVQEAFNEQIDRWGNASVMVQGGCESYYRAGGDGGVFTHWPNTVAAYLDATRAVDEGHFYFGDINQPANQTINQTMDEHSGALDPVR